jgi:hypothetical protein
MIRLQVTIVEKGHMGVLLSGHGFADIAVAFVVINRFGVARHMNMGTTASIFCCHHFLHYPRNAGCHSLA